MRKIFLLEDDQGIREVLEMLLTSENYVVECFASIKEFKNRDITIIPDLYLFDVMLPDGSGIDLCREIKNEDRYDNVPVIIMSAHANIRDLKGICEPENFISKPFDINELLERLKSAMLA
ncbi:two-component system, OmpR family, phosphate regulon response regulator PhoB [Pedobacter terrae]|uniref:Two-component system, OmpR family, phosphate regulon response regulator PhoB n=1 Tax=Pedobacter terrae TaxID=405671 RepID=A0A1G8AD25_9SPHI|nr:response regulator [Pedobacter terrae]SDH18746.1 two-component system, OmpR family, phosphate regulon response regulator PhoB [Pedobacter terrae]